MDVYDKIDFLYERISNSVLLGEILDNILDFCDAEAVEKMLDKIKKDYEL